MLQGIKQYDHSTRVSDAREAWHAVKKTEHVHMRPDPVRHAITSFGERIVRSARHRDEDLSLAYLASPWTGDRDLLAGVADEYLVAGDMMLAHYREQTTFELAKEVAKKQIR
jgi:hypothetical protein